MRKQLLVREDETHYRNIETDRFIDRPAAGAFL